MFVIGEKTLNTFDSLFDIEYEKRFELPLKSYEEADYDNYFDYANKLLENYVEYIESRVIDSDSKTKIKKLCVKLIDSIDKYLKGYHGESYLIFKDGMEIIQDDFIKLSSNNLNPTKFLIDSDKINSIDLELLIKQELNNKHVTFYRMRIDNDDREMSKMDLFHISYLDSYKIKNYRYSVSGYPCLYMGSTFKCCYNEIGKAPLEHIWISKYEVKKDVRFIDLSFSYEKLFNFKSSLSMLKIFVTEVTNNLYNSMIKVLDCFEKVDDIPKSFKIEKYNSYSELKHQVLENKKINFDERCKYLICAMKIINPHNANMLEMMLNEAIKKYKVYNKYEKMLGELINSCIIVRPLQLVTTIKKAKEGAFSPEYIISQHLMQWVRSKEDMCGIKYISTHKKLSENADEFINFALPAKKIDHETGYCKYLLELFDIGDPIKAIQFIERECD